MEQEVVNETPAEQTVETESTPVEATAQTTENVVETPTSESAGTAKVSENVPYDRFSKVNEEKKAAEERAAYLEAMLQEQQRPKQQESGEIPQLDPDAQMAVDYLINQRLEQRIEADFSRKHKDDFSDPLVKAAYNTVVQEKMNKNAPYIDREEALKEAKDLIESRLKSDVSKAKNEGVEEGQKLAQAKDDNSAIGESGANPQVDDKDLSASELAAKYNLPRED